MSMNTKHNIEATEDRVVIIPEEKEEKTAGGIFIPQEAQEKSQTGHIVNIGPLSKDATTQLKVNQRVLYSKYGGNEIKLDRQTYIVLSIKDVLAILP